MDRHAAGEGDEEKEQVVEIAKEKALVFEEDTAATTLVAAVWLVCAPPTPYSKPATNAQVITEVGASGKTSAARGSSPGPGARPSGPPVDEMASTICSGST